VTSWAEIFWKYVRKGCDRSDAAYRADLWEARHSASAGEAGTAKTAQTGLVHEHAAREAGDAQ
jgi:hypothetical protein